LGAAIHDNATGNGHDGVLSDYRSRLRHQQLALHGKRHAALTQALNNVANNPQELEAQLMLVAKDAMVANDLGDGNVNVVVYHANDGAMGGYNNGNIYINLAYQDGSVQTLMTVLGDELSHYTDHAMGVTRTVSELDNGPTDVSRHHGDNAGEQTWGYVGHEPVDAQAFQDRLVGLDVESANTEVANANGMQHRITVQVQQVVGNNYHSLIKIAPENQALYKDDARFIPDDTGELYVTLGAGPSVELIPKLTSGTNRKKDKNQAIKVVESLPLTLPNGDEDATIRQLMALDANYNDELDYDLFPSQPADQKWYISDDSYNSNSYVSGLLTAANLDVPPLHPSIHLPGYTKPLPKGYFIHSKQEVNQ
jgi:hypothetical protein